MVEDHLQELRRIRHQIGQLFIEERDKRYEN